MTSESFNHIHRILLCSLVTSFTLLAIQGCSVTTNPAMPGTIEKGHIRKQYVDGRFGQIHVYKIEPATQSQENPLMCFHPTAVSGDYFHDFMLEMGKDRIVMAMDTPGYGRSDRPPEPQSMGELAGAAADALDALGYGKNGRGPVDVIGYHTGVYIATELAIMRPDLVRRLVLPGISYYPHKQSQEKYKQYAKPTTIEEDGSHIMEIWKFWVHDRNPGVSLERGAEHFVDYLQSRPHSWWAYHSVFSYMAEERLPLVTQPVLIPNNHGSLKENSRAAAKLFPNAKLIEMPDLHHGIFDVGVDRLAEVSRPFLDR